MVSRKERGKGIGKNILRYVIANIKEKHPDSNIYLTVYPQNLPALFLYIKNGFLINDFKKDYYGKGAHRLFLNYSE